MRCKENKKLVSHFVHSSQFHSDLAQGQTAEDNRMVTQMFIIVSGLHLYHWLIVCLGWKHDA